MEREKVIVSRVSDDGKQKRLAIPKREETEDWKHDDLIKMEKIE